MSEAYEPRPSSLQVWLQAIRPATLTAGAVPVLVGWALAEGDGVSEPLACLAALISAIGIQIATNLHNDHEDFARGADTEQRLGQARATQRGWLSSRQVLTGAVIAALISFTAAGYLFSVAGWPVVWIAAGSALCAFAYTGGPWPLAYVGLGDLFVVLFFGVVAVCGTYFVQSLTLPPRVVLASLPIGWLATAILVVNNLRDRHTDAEAKKRTLVVRFGPSFGRWEYTTLVLLSYGLPLALWLTGMAGPWWLLCWLSVPLAIAYIRQVHTTDGAALNPLLGCTARLGMIYGALLSVGCVL